MSIIIPMKLISDWRAMFGHTFVIPRENDRLVMRKAHESDAVIVADQLDDYITGQFVIISSAPTIKDEEEWIEKTSKDKDSYVWMIDYIKNGHEPVLAGVTSLHRQSQYHWSSGILLSNRSLWGLGIASTTHKIRTWFAFAELGAMFITSGHIVENAASGKALASVGYVQTGRCPKCRLVAGSWRDMVDLVCYNPNNLSVLWPGGKIPKKVETAATRTKEAMRFAEQLISPR